ncbi:MAG: phospholipase D family protein [Proteobacteria bacterium]|nr:phospholipase D family protein [Pseudomonadota bacterium]
MPLRLLLAGLMLLCAVQARALERDPSTSLAAKGKVEIAFSPWNDPEAVLLKAIGEARERILVQAYLFTSKPLARALIDAHGRGVKVEVMLDAEMNRPASPSVLPTLLAAGIPVAVETRYNIAHNKVMIFDPDSPRAALATGSYNFTRAARLSNAENLLVLRGNPALVRVYADNWQRQRAEAQVVRSLEDLPERKRRESGRESDRASTD